VPAAFDRLRPARPDIADSRKGAGRSAGNSSGKVGTLKQRLRKHVASPLYSQNAAHVAAGWARREGESSPAKPVVETKATTDVDAYVAQVEVNPCQLAPNGTVAGAADALQGNSPKRAEAGITIDL
jgi:hypothetical protein